MEGMKRILDWLGYVGIAALVAAVLLPFWRPEWQRVRWALVIVGLVLVLASLLVYWRAVGSVFGRRTARYGLNTAVMVHTAYTRAPTICSSRFPPRPPAAT